jgi:hypothetical protein
MGLQFKFNLILTACFIAGGNIFVSLLLAIATTRWISCNRRSMCCGPKPYRSGGIQSEEIVPLLADQSAVQFLSQTPRAMRDEKLAG